MQAKTVSAVIQAPATLSQAEALREALMEKFILRELLCASPEGLLRYNRHSRCWERVGRSTGLGLMARSESSWCLLLLSACPEALPEPRALPEQVSGQPPVVVGVCPRRPGLTRAAATASAWVLGLPQEAIGAYWYALPASLVRNWEVLPHAPSLPAFLFHWGLPLVLWHSGEDSRPPRHPLPAFSPLRAFLCSASASLVGRPIPLLLQVLLVCALCVAISGSLSNLVKRASGAYRVLSSGLLAQSGWPVPQDAFRARIPPSAKVGFVTDHQGPESTQTHAHLLNALAPRLVLRVGPETELPQDMAYVVLLLRNLTAQRELARRLRLKVTGPYAFGFYLGERRP